jgi:LuxR family transcriptional regulator, maltose regulon positive regulatory protein
MAAPAPILTTKLYIPPPPPSVVVRTRLLERLDDGLTAGRTPGVTLISAPAGFGKTTLVSEWVAGFGRPTAWLSLEEGDSDPIRFLTYLVAALRTIAPSIGEGVLEILQSAQSQPPLESILTALLNEIATIPGSFLLVLDDYHVIESRTVDEALTFLVEHLPPRMHLVITTREDPALPLPRLRARRQLTELRAADLRFTPPEAAEFLNRVMGLQLSAEEVAALEARTEGWIAGLQLAALSMRGHRDVAEFIQAFAGDNRYIVDYLMEEVLQRQPESVRSFLLQTSILERLNGPLCDTVTGQVGGKARLEALQRGNFFLIPLDDRRHWYRYHHLFADVLHMHLLAEQPDQLPVLHGLASEWFEQNGSAGDAIHHALAAQDFERAADLIERVLPAMRQARQEPTLLSWLQALPETLFRDRPVLSAHFVGVLMQNGQFEGVASLLQDAERWLDEDLRDRPVYADEEEFRRLPSSVAMYHAAIALAGGDVTNAMKYARQVLELAPRDDNFPRGAASSLLGLAFWTSGDLEAAYPMYAEGMAYLQQVGYMSDVIGGSVTLADIRMAQGRLREAMSTYERGLRLATAQGGHPLRGAADMHVGMSELHRERNELEPAEQHLLKSRELGELNGLPKNPYRWRVAMARLREAQGGLDEALDLLEEAERRYVGDFSPNVRPIPALKTRLWLTQGKLEKALGWAREQGLSPVDELSYLREFEHITLARILLARSRSEGADTPLQESIDLLERLLKAAEQGKRMGSAIEILALLALAHQAQGDFPAALQYLERALRLAEPEGYVRLFLDEGQAMRSLIESQSHGPDKLLPAYSEKLLAAFAQSSPVPHPAILPIQNQKSTIQNLIEPLSQRELDVLRYFKTELSGPEIARELVIGLSTVRTHTKSIYSKLGVNSRRGAVRRAEELGLL